MRVVRASRGADDSGHGAHEDPPPRAELHKAYKMEAAVGQD